MAKSVISPQYIREIFREHGITADSLRTALDDREVVRMARTAMEKARQLASYGDNLRCISQPACIDYVVHVLRENPLAKTCGDCRGYNPHCNPRKAISINLASEKQ